MIDEITFKDNNLILAPPITLHPFMYIEWLIYLDNRSAIIFDIENFDENIPAELILPQSKI